MLSIQKFPDILPKLIPIISILFLVAAVMGEGLYYQTFGINIFTYTSLSEIVSIFIDSIPILLLISFTVILYTYMISSIFEKHLEKMFNNLKLNRRERKKQLVKSLYISTLLLTVWMLTTMLLPSFPFISRRFIFSETYFFIKALAHYLLILWLFISSINIQPSYTSEYHKGSRYIILFIVTFFITIYFKSRFETFMIHANPNHYPQMAVIMKDGKLISSDSNTIFIGKTKEYIFIHYPNEPLEFTRVINMADVKVVDNFKYVGRFTFP